jgi:hypothetical protein
VKPAPKAVDWLLRQQCANGAFAPFRAEPAKPCGAKAMVDTNNTAAAVQALTALGGHDAAAGKAVDWLKSVQNEDGGWGYVPGGASDTNSTSVVVGALAAAGEKPAAVVKGGRSSGKSPYDALRTLALPCEGEDAGAFAFQPDKKGRLAANADATAAGVLGAPGKGLVVTAGKKTDTASKSSCTDPGRATPEQAAANGVTHLAKSLAEDGHLTLAGAGGPDFGNTADSVVALAARRRAAPLRERLAGKEVPDDATR